VPLNTFWSRVCTTTPKHLTKPKNAKFRKDLGAIQQLGTASLKGVKFTGTSETLLEYQYRVTLHHRR
jgi:hypothetical protein